MIPGVASTKVSLAPPKNIYEVLNSKRNEMVKSRVNYRCRGDIAVIVFLCKYDVSLVVCEALCDFDLNVSK